MEDLEQLRLEIDQTDEEIVRLLNKRAQIVLKVGKAKEKLNLGYYDPSRENAVYERLQKLNQGPFGNEALKSVFREIMSASLALEHPLKVAYFGPKATFTHLACMKRFGLSAQFIPVRGIEDVFGEVERDLAQYGVVPVENSTEGIVSHTLDMFIDSELKICGEILLPISHNLLSKSDHIAQITKIYSHRQPIAQTRRWLRDNLPDVDIIEVASTAKAAELAAEDPESAAIASDLAAQLYDLKILKQRIEDNVNNVTRFLIIAQKHACPTGKDKTSLMFAIKDKVGALHDMLQAFARYNVNLTKIESRPSKKKVWEYIFYVDTQGHIDDSEVKSALEELQSQALFVKFLGSYPQGELG
ncbi:MAG: prephenate dehydratase [Candidatus Schekmanbacteria bacterium]|nr:prephenate dehydratase [Candidatus Schekmanbacteria bacterium]